MIFRIFVFGLHLASALQLFSAVHPTDLLASTSVLSKQILTNAPHPTDLLASSSAFSKQIVSQLPSTPNPSELLASSSAFSKQIAAQLPKTPNPSELIASSSVVSDQIISQFSSVETPAYAVSIASSSAITIAVLLPMIALNGFNTRARETQRMIDIPDDIETPYGGGADNYSPEKAEAFYKARPLLVATRVIFLLQATLSFQLKLLIDWQTGNLEKNEKIRAREALDLVSDIGPTAIKLGQALSIRTDLIPEAYALELRKLQDAVPPFPDAQAQKVMEKAFEVQSLDEVFEDLEKECIASASIGQVYRGKLKPGKYTYNMAHGTSASSGVDRVAVKVQRPGVLAEICLDLYLLRVLAPLQVTISNAINKRSTEPEDIETALALVDEWGRGFVNEVDYQAEATNTEQFAAAMRARGLNAVISPRVVRELSATNNVLVTEWIDGTRLDASASPDVPRLCGVAINAYLTMLLDTGVLHCDPHPGNLLRTRDGNLCILDWGMTLSVPNDLQLSLLEFIAHINTENLDAVPQDFVNLGFTPPDQLERVRTSGITDGLSFMLRQLSDGGGAKKVQQRVKAEFIERYGDVSDEELRARARADMIQRMEVQLEKEGVDVRGVSNVMEEMSRRNRELFSLPTWVLYTVRAFSTIEGLGLSIDEDYAILKECFPYLARRLLTDESPRARKALEEMVSSKSGRGLDLDKLLEMSEGFTGYTVSTKRVVGESPILYQEASSIKGPPALLLAGGGSSSSTELATVLTTADQTSLMNDSSEDEAEAAAKRELAQVLLSKNGSTAQKLVIEEATRLADAALRNSLATALDATGLPERSDQGGLGAAVKTLRGLPAPARLGLLPLTAGVELAAASANVLAPLVAVDDDDRRALATLEKLGELSSNTGGAQPSELAKLAAPDGDLLKLATDPEAIDTASNLARRFASTLLHRAAGRIDQASDYAAAASGDQNKIESSSSGTTTIERTLTKSIASTLAQTYRQAARTVSPDNS